MIHRIALILSLLFISLTIASCCPPHYMGKGLEQEKVSQPTTSTPQTPSDTGGGKALKKY